MLSFSPLSTHPLVHCPQILHSIPHPIFRFAFPHSVFSTLYFPIQYSLFCIPQLLFLILSLIWFPSNVSVPFVFLTLYFLVIILHAVFSFPFRQLSRFFYPVLSSVFLHYAKCLLHTLFSVAAIYLSRFPPRFFSIRPSFMTPSSHSRFYSIHAILRHWYHHSIVSEFSNSFSFRISCRCFPTPFTHNRMCAILYACCPSLPFTILSSYTHPLTFGLLSL